MEELSKKYMDIEGILEKIKNLPIDDKDKADILQTFKYNLQNPDMGEMQNLDQIQQKYTGIPPSTLPSSSPLPSSSSPYQTQNIFPSAPSMPISTNMTMQQQQTRLPPMPYNYGYESNMGMMQNQGNLMTTTHFEILKSKLDSLQLELVDLLRHVKDYTQRYMNAIRQQDMEKIDQYINGLFQVDKAMKETQERAEEARIVAEAAAGEGEEEESNTKEGVLGRATSGITSFFGGLGDNVSKLTNFVSDTAGMANSFLSKKLIGSSSNAAPVESPKVVSNNKNELSVEEYMSNMNQMNGTSNSPMNMSNPNVVSSSMNNINKPGNTNKTNNNIKPNNTNTNTNINTNTTPTPETKPKQDEDLNKALLQLNEEINKDIEKTVNTASNQSISTTTQPIQNQSQNQMGGGNNETKLTRKIKMLRLKLTKKRLQKQWEEEKNTGSTIKKHHNIKRLNVNRTKRKHK